jgi:hypothetical protein
MLRKSILVVLLVLAAAPVSAQQDVLTIGSGAAPPGGTVSIPVYLRDRTGTPLDTYPIYESNSIAGVAFKVLYPTDLVASVTVSRADFLPFDPIYEAVREGTGFVSYAVACEYRCHIDRDRPPPGEHFVTLGVTLQPNVPLGTAVVLRIEPSGAMFSNRMSTITESVASGHMTVVDGIVTVGNLGPPTDLVATAVTTSQVDLYWNGVAMADHYEVWRSSDGQTYSLIGTPAIASWTDLTVAPSTAYLYRVRTVDGGGGLSAFTAPDLATTVVFTDNPLVSQVTPVKFVHFAEIRTAVNAIRAMVGMAPMASDPTFAQGAIVRQSHVIALQDAFKEANREIGVAYYSSYLLPHIYVADIHDLRRSVR